MDGITYNGEYIDLTPTDSEKKQFEIQHAETIAQRNSWVNNGDKFDQNPETQVLRKSIKNGVLSYSKYNNAK